MKQLITTTLSLFLLAACSLVACKKKDDIFKPQPPAGKPSFLYGFEVAGLPETAGTLSAVVSIINDKNETVVSDRQLALQFNGRYVTERLELPRGTYRLSKFLVQEGGKTVRFAAPLQHAQKAGAVQKPLPLQFQLPQPAPLLLPVEVVRVEARDRAEQFGYPAGAFNQDTPADPQPFLRIKVQAVIKIGDVVYDHVPAALSVISWDNNGQMHRKDTQLAAGVNEVPVPAAHMRYQLRTAQWGVTDQLMLERNDLQEGTVYVLGGSRAAKKLRSEITYLFVNGIYVPESKKTYMYDGNRLVRVDYYERKQGQHTPNLIATDHFTYNGQQLKEVRTLDHSNNDRLIGFRTFGYDVQGRVAQLYEKGQGVEQTHTIGYSSQAQGGIISTSVQDHLHAPNTARHQFRITTGNKVEGASESLLYRSTSHYRYDTNINPYVHMNWPAAGFERQSKNNLVTEHSSVLYSSGSSIVSQSGFTYRYDAEGYPIQVTRLSTLGQERPVSQTIYTY